MKLTDQNYPSDPRDSMTPEDILELKLLDSKIRLEHSAAKMAEAIRQAHHKPKDE